MDEKMGDVLMSLQMLRKEKKRNPPFYIYIPTPQVSNRDSARET